MNVNDALVGLSGVIALSIVGHAIGYGKLWGKVDSIDKKVDKGAEQVIKVCTDIAEHGERLASLEAHNGSASEKRDAELGEKVSHVCERVATLEAHVDIGHQQGRRLTADPQ